MGGRRATQEVSTLGPRAVMPFSEHIIHAIIINLIRLPKYALLSKGRSLPISIGLILFEVSIIPLALFYDFWSRLRFSKIAHLIMVDDFISMKETPSFKIKASDIPSLASFQWQPIKKWRQESTSLLKKGEWQRAIKHCESIRLNLIKEQAGSHYLCIHFLESVQLAITNTIDWQKLLPEHQKDQFLKHRLLFVWWQAVGYEGAQFLDRMAFPLHQRIGLPILKNDVPLIPV